MEALVLGDSVVHHIIGIDTVLTYQDPMIDSVFVNTTNYNWEGAGVSDEEHWRARAGEKIAAGYIALQAESHPIDFKDIRVVGLEGMHGSKGEEL